MEDHMNMQENTQSFQGSDALEIELLLDSEEPAFATAIGLDTVQALRNEGYRVHPLYTGQKGGGIEVMVVLSQALTFLRDHHTTLSEGIQDSSALVSIFSGLLPIYKKIFQAFEKRTHTDPSTSPSIHITVEIDGHPITVEADDMKQAEAALLLAQRFSTHHPQATQKQSTKRKVKTHVQVVRPPRKKISK